MQAPAITTALAGIRQHDLAEAASRRRQAWAPAALDATDVTIRLARADDHPALARLSQLDGAGHDLSGDVLVAEAEGVVVAARSVLGGTALSDPFRASSALVALLDVRAEQLAGRRARPRRPHAPRQSMPVLRVGGAR
jgi:hypothetical protein